MKRTETRHAEVTYCDRCGKSGGTMVTTDDPMSLLPRTIDLCVSCADVVLPALFAPTKPPKRQHKKREKAKA